MDDLDSYLSIIRELNDASIGSRNQALEKLKDLQAKLKDGESTGDRVQDFIIACFGILSPKDQQPYRTIFEKFDGKEGEQVLVIDRHKEDLVHYCIAPPPGTYIPSTVVTNFRLGVLDGDLELDIVESLITLPMERHVRLYGAGTRTDWKLEEGPISFKPYQFAELGQEIQSSPDDLILRSEPLSKLEIIFGEGVGNYFRADHPNQADYPHQRFDFSYVRALELLDEEVPEDFREAYEDHLNATTEVLVGRLLASVNDKSPKSVDSRKRDLKEALSLGLHRRTYILRPQSGVSIDVPSFILSSCVDYGMEIPE